MSQCVCACGEDGLLPASEAVLQWMHSLDNSQPLGPPESMPEVRRISSEWVMINDGQRSTSFYNSPLKIYSTDSFYSESAVSSKYLPVLSVHMIISLSAYNQVPHTQMKTYLHDIEKHFLAQAVLLLEEFMFRISAGNVSANQLLTGWRHLQEFWVLILYRHILGIAQQLPHYCPKVVRNPFSDKILWEKERKGTFWNWY